jgi:CelD/BcsL family acetyltransferase involved in cellulose biosynthesis
MSACDHGLKKFDMLLGAHEYKSRYAAVEEDRNTDRSGMTSTSVATIPRIY